MQTANTAIGRDLTDAFAKTKRPEAPKVSWPILFSDVDDEGAIQITDCFRQIASPRAREKAVVLHMKQPLLSAS